MKFPDPTKSLAEQDPLVLLAITVWGEARGTGQEGQAAVAHVVMNRVRKKGWTITRTALDPWDFSCFNKKKAWGGQDVKRLLRPVEAEGLGTWASCWRAASDAFSGQSADPTGGATHYCRRELWNCAAVAGHPQWNDENEIKAKRTKKTVQIGDHVFATAPF